MRKILSDIAAIISIIAVTALFTIGLFNLGCHIGAVIVFAYGAWATIYGLVQRINDYRHNRHK